jgi:NAD(P)H dehydrogenase (quinone)
VCPMLPRAADAAAEMRATVEAIAAGLRAEAPTAVLAISDYGAQLDGGTGITMVFHELERALQGVAPAVTFLRSAEHMHNWGRFARVARETGVLPSLHQPLTKLFPQVAAPDVGLVATELLLSMTEQPPATRIIHVEGPRRYTALDVATTLSELTGRQITAEALPRSDWVPALTRGGLGTSYAELVATMFDAHNAGRIDVDDQADQTRYGATKLREVLVSQLT